MEKSQPCIIYLVRHGETSWNAVGRIQGHTDIGLNEKGEAQAHALRSLLKGIKFDAAYSSDLIRAKRTAEILLLEHKLKVTTNRLIRERYFGIYEGKYTNDQERMYRLLNQYGGAHPELTRAKVETNESMQKRARDFLIEIGIAHPRQTVLVVAHGGILKQLLIHLRIVQYDTLQKGAIKNLAYLKLKIQGTSIQLLSTFGIEM